MDVSTSVLDEAYGRLAATGPELHGWLSNHGPMVADALVRLGRPDHVATWLRGYVTRLEPPPPERWPIAEEEWREPLGDPSRLGDWSALLGRQVRAEPWEDVLARWWPRLLPGAVASAAHGLIRTGHVVRALRADVTDPRVDELGRALGYWAARWQPLPGLLAARGGDAGGGAVPDTLPTGKFTGGIRTRLARLGEDQAWSGPFETLRTPAPTLSDGANAPAIADRLHTLVDTAIAWYWRWAHGNPVMLVHAVTAPRAVALVLPSLPRSMWSDSYDVAWTVASAIATVYRPPAHLSISAPVSERDGTPVTLEEVIDRAISSGDEHAIKLTEVAVEFHRRGSDAALPAAARAVALIGTG